MATAPKFYLTTAIHYTNGPPHIGHAYEMVASDAIARFKRLDGYDVFAMTGTDEHGQKVQRTAAQNDLSPKEFVDTTACERNRDDAVDVELVLTGDVRLAINLEANLVAGPEHIGFGIGTDIGRRYFSPAVA